jgi:xanthine dehydrogenase accessory factor
MDVWTFILEKLSDGINIELIYVLESKGSSPGRRGFKMAVAADGAFSGTIGGGIMEHKLVEKAKALLRQNETKCLLMHQHHDKDHSIGQSGMICSGTQVNAFVPVFPKDKNIVKKIQTGEKGCIRITHEGIQYTDETVSGFQYETDEAWYYTELISKKPVIHIIGGGHVSLALSELMHFLGFCIKVYDDRRDLNTMQQNYFAHEKHTISSYDKINASMNLAVTDYVVVISFGYRTDKEAMRQLLKQEFFYLGLIGSDKKIETIFSELKEEGIPPLILDKVHAPVGMKIYSKTAKEIAVSIAAEIIREKNKNLPTGRTY